jgi:sterol desaturase/sphingolipid hydroxylase (fatty acid hydroxylase superfamily)
VAGPAKSLYIGLPHLLKADMSGFLAKVKAHLLEPFASWDSFVSAISGVFHAFTSLSERLAWPYLLSCVVIAYALYRVRKKRGEIAAPTSFRQFAFPGEVYRHRSALVDYKFVFFDLTVRGLLYAPFASGLGLAVYRLTLAVAGGAALGPATAHPRRDAILLTVVSFVLTDFGSFVSHYFLHRIPVLWHFHEVHHSAEVLTPVTLYRVHPVERIIGVVTGGVLGGVAAALFTFASRDEIAAITVLGVNVFTFVLFEFLSALRHSHIWLSYGPVLSRVLISPAQHQIHHSVAPEHLEKNYGFCLAIWDVMLGSLYVPRQVETPQFGVPAADPRDFSSVPRLYFLPFAKAFRHMRNLKDVRLSWGWLHKRVRLPGRLGRSRSTLEG